MILMHQTMRWFGPGDPVSLQYLRQAGCKGVVTALHHIPVGEVWPVEEIRKRKAMIEEAGMRWTVIESLPVHEDIKKQSGKVDVYIANYCQSLRNVAACGLEVVTYNFMPVLDWMRTEIAYAMPDGSKALYFKRSAFIAFDLFLLKRPEAEKDYTAGEIEKAAAYFSGMAAKEKDTLFYNALLGLPGSDDRFTRDGILSSIDTYTGIDASKLKQHLFYFLQQIVPLTESLGLKLAIHPDDPPYPVLGLPRVVSTAKDLEGILAASPSPANGLCYCTGSLGARPDNDLLEMLGCFGDHIHFLHLRNTKRDGEGNFYEADHLDGDADMSAIVKEVLKIMQRRSFSLPMRPDHGHQMLDDLHKTTYPGYSAIGRLRGLAELRGLELGIAKSMEAF